MTLTGYHLHPSETVLSLRTEFPDFLICELGGGLGKSCFIAISTHGRPELVVAASPEELRQALTVRATEESCSEEGGGRQ